MMHAFLGESMEKVKQIAREPFKNYLRHSIGLTRNIAAETGLDMKKNVDQLVEVAAQHFFQSSGVFGTPEDCIEHMKSLYQMGVNEIACLIDFGIDNKTTIQHFSYLLELQNLVRRTDLGQQWLPEIMVNEFEESNAEDRSASANIFENNLNLFNQ